MAKNKEKIMNLDGEEWKSVGTVKGVDFTGQYEVSNNEPVFEYWRLSVNRAS